MKRKNRKKENVQREIERGKKNIQGLEKMGEVWKKTARKNSTLNWIPQKSFEIK